MSDLISRQAAIDALNKLDVSDGVGISSIACGVQEAAVIAIQHLPSAQQWIPCSERQPEETNLYWVTVKPQNSEMLEVTQRLYLGRGYGDGWEAELYEPPLAWMPMEWPEPWIGGEG